MAIKPIFLASMGYQYFLSYGAPLAGLWGARSSAIIKVMFSLPYTFCLHFCLSHIHIFNYLD